MIQFNDGKDQYYLDLFFTVKPQNVMGVTVEVKKEGSKYSEENPYSTVENNLEPYFVKEFNFHFEALIEIITTVLENSPMAFYKYVKNNHKFGDSNFLNSLKDVLKYVGQELNNLRG